MVQSAEPDRAANDHDALWQKRIAEGDRLNPSNASVLRLVPDLSPSAALFDAGCGTGLLLSHFPNHARTGIDFSPVAVETAQRHGIDARVGNLNDPLPFKDRSFDLVFSVQVLQHVADPLFVLRELARVSRGHVILNVPNHAYWHFRIDLLMGRLPAVLASHPAHARLFTRTKIMELIEQSGLRIEREDDSGNGLAHYWPSLWATGFSFRCRAP